jgi:hypothetical protein
VQKKKSNWKKYFYAQTFANMTIRGLQNGDYGCQKEDFECSGLLLTHFNVM